MCHHTAEAKNKQIKNKVRIPITTIFHFPLRALVLFGLLKDVRRDRFCRAVHSGPSVIPHSSSCCPNLRSALNKTSRRAVRDQLTLKLLDFALKAPAPQMSTELCRQIFISISFLPLCVQTLPAGMWCRGKHGLCPAGREKFCTFGLYLFIFFILVLEILTIFQIILCPDFHL